MLFGCRGKCRWQILGRFFIWEQLFAFYSWAVFYWISQKRNTRDLKNAIVHNLWLKVHLVDLARKRGDLKLFIEHPLNFSPFLQGVTTPLVFTLIRLNREIPRIYNCLLLTICEMHMVFLTSCIADKLIFDKSKEKACLNPCLLQRRDAEYFW